MASALSLGDLGNDVEVVIHERSVSFRINSEILFDSSQADLSRSGLSVLRRIIGVLSETGHEVTVEGHTDAVPVRRNARYPSNWELSSARAGSVVRYLQANGIHRSRLKAVGYADTRPIADNNTPVGRAANRRVELMLEKRD
ncbi:MAG: OmpA family protein [Alcaligenaceae bacterium]|nr:OmpA family protein [Alcaligenaceae bacterium]